MQEPIAIEARNVRRVYQSGTHEVVALDGIDLRIPAGHFIALKGRSGSGKTTLLNCLGGLDQPTDGQIRIFDREIQEQDEEANTSWRQKEVGFIFQSFGLLPTLSAYENVELMLRIAGVPRGQRRARATAVLERVGLGKWADHRPYEMSGGQQQRVAIARALATNPKLILADEATGELDSETAQEVLGLLRQVVREEGVTILLATHDSLVDEFVDEVLYLVDGRVVSSSGTGVVQTSFADEPPVNGVGKAETAVSPHAPTLHTPHPTPQPIPEPSRADFGWAALIGFIALLAYWRTMAPDILYGDSGEFQVLAHTPALAHPTGYPVYILLSTLLRLVNIGTLAARVTFLSVVGAAGAVAMVYLLGRFVTRSRAAAALASFALGFSYTLWSQAVIAEVYTLGMLWAALIMFCLWRWQTEPDKRPFSLFLGVVLIPLSLGVHLYVGLTAVGAFVFTLATIWQQGKGRTQSLVYATAGTVIGVGLYLLAFTMVDGTNARTGYNPAVLFPARAAWNLAATDYDTAWERLYLSISAPQWQEAMFPGGLAFMAEKGVVYLLRLFAFELSLLAVVGAVIGLRTIWRRQRPFALYLLVALATVLFMVINYEPGDKHIFFLPSYLLLTVALAAGLEQVIAWGQRRVRSRTAVEASFMAVVVLLLLGQHFWPSRLAALAAGAATFVLEDYPFPLHDLAEPRRVAEERITHLPQGALLLMDWRDMYALYYVGLVEGKNPGLEILEATPYGTDGQVVPTALDQVEAELRQGRFVFTQWEYGGLNGRFRLTFHPDTGFYRVQLRE